MIAFKFKQSLSSPKPRYLATGVFAVWAGALIAITLIYPKPAMIMDENLEKFRELTATDPLFYDPAMDVGLLQKSVAELKHQDDLILYVDRMFRPGGDPKYRDVFPDEWRLWPDEFLETLPYIHVATKKFLDAPSREGAEILLEWYEKSALSYKKAIDLHIQAIDNVFRANPKMPRTKIMFLGSGTTPQIVRNDFTLIQKNAEQLIKEISERKQCLYSGKCPSPTAPPAINNNPEKPLVRIPFDPLPNELLGIKPEDKVLGPYWAKTPCFGDIIDGVAPSRPFYLKVQQLSTNSIWLKAISTNEKYYRDYTEVPEQPEAKFGFEKGIKIWPHFETNDYLCTDLQYLADLYSQFLTKTGIAQSNKLAALPYLIQNTLSFSWFPVYYSLAAKNNISPPYFLVTRSAYSLYFGTFSPAIWRINKEPQFLLRQNFDFKQGYSTYADLTEKMSYEEILELNFLPSLRKLYLRTASESPSD